jgi:phenylacetate-CoA ligase
VNEDAVLVEVVGPDGAAVPSGTRGELVVTPLSLTAMPLIRYRTGDIAARLAGTCECGRGLGLMTRVEGRTAHAIRRPHGGLITTPVITSLFGRANAYEWVRRFQVREEPGFRLGILLETRQPPSEAQLATLAATLQEGVGPDFQVVLAMVDRIPLAPSGKLQFLVPLAPQPGGSRG